jgi:NitT/TauT family transport system permease protein
MMDTPLMFAVLVLIAMLGMLVYEATLALERWLLSPYSKHLEGGSP